MRVGTNEPIAGAQVILSRVMNVAEIVDAGLLAGPTGIPPAVTDSKGRFAFADLEPGKYRMVAEGERYPRQEFGPVLDVAANAAVKDVVFQLTAETSLGGRVLSDMGTPLPGIEVVLLRPGYDPIGLKTFAAENTMRTNDRGEYRLFGVKPGRYYLSARVPMTPDRSGAGNPWLALPAFEALGRYSTVFYPRETDVSRAELIEVGPGSELTAMDFVLLRLPEHRIRGSVIDGATGHPPLETRGPVSMSLLPRRAVGLTGLLSSVAPYNPLDGTFELSRVPSGEYWVVARKPLPRSVLDAGGLPPPVPVARAAVDVLDSDVSNVVLRFELFVSVSGQMSVEDKAFSTLTDFQRIRVSLMPPNVEKATIGGIPGLHAPPRPDGTFVYEGLVPDAYRVTFAGLPLDSYVKEARYGDVDVLVNLMTVSSPPESLKILISPRASRINGRVLGETLQEIVNTEVVLVPEHSRHRADLYKTATTDNEGRFTIRGIAPGKYSVFAGEALNGFAYFDPAFADLHKDKGAPVHIEESAQIDVEVKLTSNMRR